MLQLTFLGTSAGVPTKQRNVTALAVECLNPFLNADRAQSRKNRPWVLIDCGEGTQHQLLHTKLSLSQLQLICITHVHGDHCYGLPGLLASAAMSGRTQPLTLIAPKAIGKLLDTLSITTELYFPFAINFVAIEDLQQADGSYKAQTLRLGSAHELVIDITPLSHRVPSYGFGITQNIGRRVLNTERLNKDGIAAGQVWGQLQQGKDVSLDTGEILHAADYTQLHNQRTKVVIAGDNDAPERLQETLKDAALLVHEATYVQAQLEKVQSNNKGYDPMHSSAAQVAKAATEMNVNQLILTHFSARYQSFEDASSDTPNMAHIRADAEAHYSGALWLAADFAQYMVAPDKETGEVTVSYLGNLKHNESRHNKDA
ncbi:MBL fold metallo-hydrolase [Psychrobacter aestuarii]|uniref:Ribonuclease Z n=1 Tax=Psychrobacter aestuarii TaxID=556327 RepID=A0ABP3FP48_9GAMM|nr:MBL fold metallo-hydrolase [Psychrobacter aestuarii]